MHKERTCIGIFILHRGWSLHKGPPVNVPVRRTAPRVPVIPANDTGKRVRTPIFSRHRRGSNPGYLAPGDSALSHEVPFRIVLVLKI